MKFKSTTTLLLVGATITVAAAWAVPHWHQQRERIVGSAERKTQAQPQATPASSQSPAMPSPTPNARRTRQVVSPEKQPVQNVALPGPFYSALEKALAGRGWKLKDVCSLEDPVARRVLEEYGAVFVAKAILPPPVCMFRNEGEVLKFQNEAKFTSASIGGATIELQPAAMEALLAARAAAHKEGLDITPRGGDEAGRRGYADTLRLWNSRFFPALTHWTQKGRISQKEAVRLRSLPVPDQVREVLALEKQGLFFSKDLSKSILYSVAAPGTSQHITMLAFDVAQYGNARVRRILAAHGWFQTVKSDLPHFTYLGASDKDLPAAGLTSVTVNAQVFWIPDIVK